MDHVTFQAPNPMMGIPPDNTNRIGGFTTKSEGVGDLKFSALHRLYDDPVNHIHLNLGISAPTCSVKKRDTLLDPFGRAPEVRLPHSMQIGTGTWDILRGITYHAREGDVSWGAQYIAEVRLESGNSEGYAFGDKHSVTGRIAYQFAPWISTSFRAEYMTQGDVDVTIPRLADPFRRPIRSSTVVSA